MCYSCAQVCSTGEFFHIDFGWAFGKDPKPQPPKIRINKNIVLAMGGFKHRLYVFTRRPLLVRMFAAPSRRHAGEASAVCAYCCV